MKNIALVFTWVVASAAVFATTAFSSSGPFGTSGPADYKVMTKENGTVHADKGRGTGPYGALAVRKLEPGEISLVAATPGGSGPFGLIAGYGMIQGGGSATVGAVNDCIVLAKNCIPDR